MKRSLIAFDLDNTLAGSKSPITREMARLLDRLLARFQVCVISGGKFEQFETQLLDHLSVAHDKLAALHVMPTCGTRYYRFDGAPGNGSDGRHQRRPHRRPKDRGADAHHYEQRPPSTSCARSSPKRPERSGGLLCLAAFAARNGLHARA